MVSSLNAPHLILLPWRQPSERAIRKTANFPSINLTHFLSVGTAVLTNLSRQEPTRRIIGTEHIIDFLRILF